MPTRTPQVLKVQNGQVQVVTEPEPPEQEEGEEEDEQEALPRASASGGATEVGLWV